MPELDREVIPVVQEATPKVPFTKLVIERKRNKLIFDYLNSSDNPGYDPLDPNAHRLLSETMYTTEMVETVLSAEAADSSAPDANQPSAPTAPAKRVRATARVNAATVPVTRPESPKAPSLSEDDEEAKKNKEAKALIRRVLRNGLAVTKVTPAVVRTEGKRAQLKDKWHNPLDADAQSDEDKLGWPLHARVDNVRKSLYEKIASHDGVLSESKAKLTSYNRVPDSILPSAGAKHLWYHGEDPGWGDRVPKDALPIQPSRTASTQVNALVELADLRALRDRAKRGVKYTNVLAHVIDMVTAISARNLEPDSEDWDLMKDISDMASQAITGLAADTQANVISHQVFERHIAMERDGRLEVHHLLAVQKGRARVTPVDSDTHTFGTERKVLEADIIRQKEESRRPITIQGSTSSHAPKQTGGGGHKKKQHSSSHKTSFPKPSHQPQSQGGQANSAQPQSQGKKKSKKGKPRDNQKKP